MEIKKTGSFEMREVKDTCRIAVVQAEPVMFDKEACIAKAIKYLSY